MKQLQERLLAEEGRARREMLVSMRIKQIHGTDNVIMGRSIRNIMLVYSTYLKYVEFNKFS